MFGICYLEFGAYFSQFLVPIPFAPQYWLCYSKLMKAVARGLAGVLHDTAKQGSEAVVDIANEAAHQVVGAPTSATASKPVKAPPTKPAGNEKTPPAPPAPEKVANTRLEEEMTKARQARQQQAETWEKRMEEQLKALREEEEKSVEADAEEIMPQGKKPRGMAPWAVKGRQGTRETKAQKGG